MYMKTELVQVWLIFSALRLVSIMSIVIVVLYTKDTAHSNVDFAILSSPDDHCKLENTHSNCQSLTKRTDDVRNSIVVLIFVANQHQQGSRIHILGMSLIPTFANIQMMEPGLVVNLVTH